MASATTAKSTNSVDGEESISDGSDLDEDDDVVFDDFDTCDCMQTSEPRLSRIPYSSLYDDSSKSKRNYLIPAMPVKATITHAERDTGTGVSVHLFNPYLYTIKLEHGPFSWEVKRRYRDFLHLHNVLRLFRATERVKYPVRRIQEKRRNQRIEKVIADVVDNVQDAFTGDTPEPTSADKKDNTAVDTGGRDNPALTVTGTTNSASSTPYSNPRLDVNNIAPLPESPNSGSQLIKAYTGNEDPTSTTTPIVQPRRFSRKSHRAPPDHVEALKLDDYYQRQRVPGQLHFDVKEKQEPSGVDNSQGHDTTDETKSSAAKNGTAVLPQNHEAGFITEHPHRVGKRHSCKLPRFPVLPEAMLSSAEDIQERMKTLERYLQCVLHIQAYRHHKETILFLNVSRLSFVNAIGGKYQEGVVKKRPGGRRQFHGLKRFCIEHCSRWGKRWLIIKDTCVIYMNPDTEELRYVLLFDWSFDVRFGAEQTEGIRHGLLISNLTRELLLKCDSHNKAEEWRNSIMAVAESKGKIWLEKQRFGSFAPPRHGLYAQWFVDGRTYMENVANALEVAREEIFITDWWLSPEIYLKRPAQEYWRLDEVLRRKALQGVNVYVLLYKEVEMALGINSLYSKRFLMNLHPRIKVLRHPDHLPTSAGGGVLLWAHHEKLVIVDQNIAFVGGIDLCYGRWDDNEHRLTDMGSVQYKTAAAHTGHSLMFGMRSIAQGIPAIPGIDVDGFKISETSAEVSASDTPPFNDIVDASPKVFVAHPLTTVHEESKEITNCQPEALPNAVVDELSPSTKVVNTWSNCSNPNQKIQSNGASLTSSANKKWSGFKDVAASIVVASKSSLRHGSADGERDADAESCNEQSLKRQSSAPPNPTDGLSPKLDMAAIVQQYREMVKQSKLATANGTGVPVEKGLQSSAQKRRSSMKLRSIAALKMKLHRRAPDDDKEELHKEYEAIWQKIRESEDHCDLMGAGKMWIGKDYVNFIFKDFSDLQLPFHDFIDRSVTPRMPWHDIASVVYGAGARDVARHFIQRWNAAKVEKAKNADKYPLLLPKCYDSTDVNVPRVFRNISHKCNVQVLRSASLWSVDSNCIEDSIHQAYIHMIENSKHYIYIENQFFVSMLGTAEVSNSICQALCKRIVRAYNDRETFRVYILMPLLPGFEGQIGAGTGSALQAVLHWTYRSLCRGPNSLLSYLNSTVDDASRFITFCGLRTHDELTGRLITELVYIHSKLIIVDDCCCLIGSANINDRSQRGNRDSEVAIYVEDCEFEPSKMNGVPYKAGKFCSSLRKNLFQEHLGLLFPSKNHYANAGSLDVSDPVSDEFFGLWCRIAAENTELYEKVFRCIPSNEIQSFEQYQRYAQQILLVQYNRALAREFIDKIQGHLVLFPLNFLCLSDLAPSFKTKEGLAPVSLWT